MKSFSETLAGHGLSLTRAQARCLQINVGRMCNQTCAHCHHDCSPGETETMSLTTARAVADFARRGGFTTVDITGGAPELNQASAFLLNELAGDFETVFRTNLTALMSGAASRFMPLLAEKRVRLAASFPSWDKEEFEAQRGRRTFDLAVRAVQKLNALGYGAPGSGLVLDLAANPIGPEIPDPEEAVEARFRERLSAAHGLVFNRLRVFANVPLGRFRERLARQKSLDGYRTLLAAAFNPASVAGLMCRTTLSVDFMGRLFDCDFNLAAGLPLGGRETRVEDMDGPPPPGSPIAVDDHCYACAAGAGFT